MRGLFGMFRSYRDAFACDGTFKMPEIGFFRSLTASRFLQARRSGALPQRLAVFMQGAVQ